MAVFTSIRPLFCCIDYGIKRRETQDESVFRSGGESITYCGTDAQKHWTRVESYGPKIVENIIQAVCRDLLADAMKSLRRQFAILMQQYKKGLADMNPSGFLRLAL